MKITMTVEFEVSDIPDDDRREIKADCGMEDDEMPRLEDMTEEEVRLEIVDAFDAMFNSGDYESQSEMWAGTNFYGYITGFSSNPTSQP